MLCLTADVSLFLDWAVHSGMNCINICLLILLGPSQWRWIFYQSARRHMPEDLDLRQFIHLVVCLTTGPKPLPNRALHIERSRASSFKCEYSLLSLRSSSSFLRFLPRLPVTSIPPFIFPSVTRCRRQFLRRMWPIQLAFCFLISCRIFLCSLTHSNISSLRRCRRENLKIRNATPLSARIG